MRQAFLLYLFLLTGIWSCSRKEVVQPSTPFNIGSTGVINGTLSTAYTCDGQSVSPPISWSNAPSGTKSFAITMHHIPPTGEKHVYYVLYNIPLSINLIPENNTSIGTFGVNTVNGRNSYTPPCSQGPGPKTYVLTVYALSSSSVSIPASTKVTMDVLLDAISTITTGKAEMSMIYSR